VHCDKYRYDALACLGLRGQQGPCRSSAGRDARAGCPEARRSLRRSGGFGVSFRLEDRGEVCKRILQPGAVGPPVAVARRGQEASCSEPAISKMPAISQKDDCAHEARGTCFRDGTGMSAEFCLEASGVQRRSQPGTRRATKEERSLACVRGPGRSQCAAARLI
jgi:hypothetical protein